MRINETQMQLLVGAANGLSSRQATIAGQISSGVRIQNLSDDPSAIGRAGNLATSLNQTDAFLGNAATVQNRMQATDSALSSVVSQLTSAISTAVGAQNGTLTPQQQTEAAQTLASIRDGILSVANSSYAGTYLFAGTTTGTAPFTQASNQTISYVGDSATVSLGLLSGSNVATSLPGSAVFTNGTGSVFGTLQNLITQLQSGSSASGPAALVSELRGALDNVLQQRQSLDSSLSRIGDEVNFQTGQEAGLKVAQSTLLGADTVSLATQLSQTQTQRSALLSTIALTEKGSIFDYLR